MSTSHAGDDIVAANAGWTFDGDVAKHFDDHVSKSVPLYNEGHELVCKLSDFFLSDGSACYELGCSTAALTEKLAAHNAAKQVTFYGIDRVPEMIAQAGQRCAGRPNIRLITQDLLDIQFEKADLIVAYYTMQFIRPQNRQILFDRIYEALNWGGAFIMFEKVRAQDARFQDIATTLYADFKLDQGYNAEEIVAKTRSLKGVLEPFSTQGNVDLLKRAGFVDILSVMKYLCFEGFLAIK